jgi:predicted Fe-Mo cluster-binding NifX family protein
MEGKRIAVAIENNGSPEGTVSAHFGRCPVYAVWCIEQGVPVKQEVVSNPYFQEHTPGAVPGFIRNLDVNVMIAGGMGPKAISMFTQMGIEVITGVAGHPEKVVSAYSRGELGGIVPCRHDHESSCGGH